MEGIEIVYPDESVAVVALQAKHDCNGKRELAAVLFDEVMNNDLVVVDVSDAVCFDSSVLHNLVEADSAAKAVGSRFVLQMGTAPIVRRAFEVSRLPDRLSVAETRSAAVSHNARTSTRTRSGSEKQETPASGV